MSKFSFNVGKKDFHTVVFKINKWLATYKIIVDGQPIKKGSKKIAYSPKRITFEVGEREKHKISIVLERGSIWEFEAKVSIDGRLRDTYFL